MSQTFIRLTESDNKLGFSDGLEALVYASIKSWCSQGKRECDLSYRQIQSYIPYVGIATIFRKIQSLIDKKLIKIVGQKTRVGGSCPIYKVSQSGTVSVPQRNALSVPESKESVPESKESVPLVGTNSPKEKRKKKEKTSKIVNNKKTSSTPIVHPIPVASWLKPALKKIVEQRGVPGCSHCYNGECYHLLPDIHDLPDHYAKTS